MTELPTPKSEEAKNDWAKTKWAFHWHCCPRSILVYWFRARKSSIPSNIFIGEYRIESQYIDRKCKLIYESSQITAKRIDSFSLSLFHFAEPKMKLVLKAKVDCHLQIPPSNCVIVFAFVILFASSLLRFCLKLRRISEIMQHFMRECAFECAFQCAPI